MISQAGSVLRHGGKMLYVTCTISKEENEEVVNHCLESHGDISLENMKDHVPQWGQDLIDNEGFLRTYPHVHHMDGSIPMFITWTAFLPHFFQKNKKCSIGFDGGSERTLIHRRDAEIAEDN
jgi:hypothetical protein